MPRARAITGAVRSRGRGRGRGVSQVGAASVARGRGGGRGRVRVGTGTSRPSAIDDINMGMVVDLPPGTGLEVPLHPRRSRNFHHAQASNLLSSPWYEEQQPLSNFRRPSMLEPSTSALQPEPSLALSPQPSTSTFQPEPSLALSPQPSTSTFQPEPSLALSPQPSTSTFQPVPTPSLWSTVLLETGSPQPSTSAFQPEPTPVLLEIGPSSPALSYEVPSLAQYVVCENTPPRRRERRVDSARPLGNLEIAGILDMGSEEEEEDDEEDLGDAVPAFVPRTLRMFFDEPSDVAELETAPPPLDTASIQDSFNITNSNLEMHGPTSMFDFEWRALPNPPISPLLRREQFVGPYGPRVETSCPYDAFRSIWDDRIIEHIVMQTNIYAQHQAVHMLESGTMLPESRLASWVDTDKDEILVYLAIVMAMSLVYKSRIPDYWSKDLSSVIVTPGFTAKMGLRRFQLLSRCLHFSNNAEFLASSSLTPAQARIYKVQPILDHLNDKFQSLYDLGQNIALDESLTQWKGWLDIKQYIPNKASKIGIKTYEVCDSKTGYLWRFEVHTGRETEESIDGLLGVSKIVMRLLQGLEHSGRTVWMDNFYNSPALARLLKTKGLDCVGTLRANCMHVPGEIYTLNERQMREGQVCGCTSGDVDLMVWKDQRKVTMISTYHGIAVYQDKPTVVMDYNICMGGVDKKDQMLAMFAMERKRTHIWYKKFFRRLLNVSILNAYILNKRDSSITHRDFRVQLVHSLLEKHHKRNPVACLVPNTFKFTAEVIAHYPHKSSLRRHCVICHRRTFYVCVACNVVICSSSNTPDPVPCHLKYHS